MSDMEGRVNLSLNVRQHQGEIRGIIRSIDLTFQQKRNWEIRPVRASESSIGGCLWATVCHRLRCHSSADGVR